VKKSVVITKTDSSLSFHSAASSGSSSPARSNGNSFLLNMPFNGRRTCSSASALYFDAQPEQVARLVSLIFLSLAVITPQ
jgi:hypothetical protein